MKKGFAAALLILTISLNSFGGDVLVPSKHKPSTTTTTLIEKITAVLHNLF